MFITPLTYPWYFLTVQEPNPMIVHRNRLQFLESMSISSPVHRLIPPAVPVPVSMTFLPFIQSNTLTGKEWNSVTPQVEPKKFQLSFVPWWPQQNSEIIPFFLSCLWSQTLLPSRFLPSLALASCAQTGWCEWGRGFGTFHSSNKIRLELSLKETERITIKLDHSLHAYHIGQV